MVAWYMTICRKARCKLNVNSSKFRMALLSDIHGNPIALDAVLADIQSQGGVDEYWILGDLVAIGPQPIQVLEQLDQLPNKRLVRGNTDRYVTNGDRPYPSHTDVLADHSLLPRLIEVTNSFSWTQGFVTSHGWLLFLDALPLEERTVLPDGTRLLGVHASPGNDDGPGIHPELDEADLVAALAGCEADLICVGHTHWPMNIRVGDIHMINLGSVSNPRIPSLGASYVILEADQTGYRVQHRQVDYDREAVIALLHQVRHPARDFNAGFMRGDHVPPWDEPDVF